MRITIISETVDPIDYTALLQEIIDALGRIEQNTSDIKMAVAYCFALLLACVVFFALYRFSRSLFRDV